MMMTNDELSAFSALMATWHIEALRAVLVQLDTELLTAIANVERRKHDPTRFPPRGSVLAEIEYILAHRAFPQPMDGGGWECDSITTPASAGAK